MKSVFIVGSGRSGTSLLQSMLDSHSEITFFKENQFLRTVYFGNSNIKNFITEKHDRIDYLSFNDYSNIDDPVLFYNKLKSLINSSQHLKYVGDKDPRLIDYVDKLPALFGDSKIIVMNRNPGDIILSRTKAEWSNKWPFSLQLIIVRGQLNYFLKNKKSISESQLIEVSYENLISQPEETLKMITNFLDIKFENIMLDFQKSSKRLTSINELQWKKNIFNKIDSSNSNIWKTEFSESRKFMIYNVFNDSYRNENMEFNLSFFEKMFLKIKLLFLIFISRFYFLRLKF
jgi:hypothetical protein